MEISVVIAVTGVSLVTKVLTDALARVLWP